MSKNIDFEFFPLVPHIKFIVSRENTWYCRRCAKMTQSVDFFTRLFVISWRIVQSAGQVSIRKSLLNDLKKKTSLNEFDIDRIP